MKKIYTLLLTLTALVQWSQAQTTLIDSVETGGSYANSVYYSLNNGIVKTTPNNNWQLAFSIGTFTVGVRANSATGTSVDGFVSIYEKPGLDTAAWTNFDTTGMLSTWENHTNSDLDWEEGALNMNASGMDYGWGEYDPNSHAVVGHRLYVAVIKSGSTTLYKKIWIVSKVSGTWTVRYANLDGSDLQEKVIRSSDHVGFNFVYLSLVNNQVFEREPAKADWDFVYTRYDAYQPSASTYYLSVGILSNAGVAVSEVRGIEETTTTIADTTGFSTEISTIGADWKLFGGTGFYVVDSLTYFVQAVDGAIWKLVFTSFASGSSPSGTGRAVFNKTKVYTPTVGIEQTVSLKNNVTVYPNPATSSVYVWFESTQTQNPVRIFDISGKTVIETTRTAGDLQPIDIRELTKGAYFVEVQSGNSRSVKKLIVN